MEEVKDKVHEQEVPFLPFKADSDFVDIYDNRLERLGRGSVDLLGSEEAQIADGSITRDQATRWSPITVVLTIVGLLRRALIGLIPSFLSDLWAPSKSKTQPRPTAWLDGLRGGAAWAVFNGHLAVCLDKQAVVSFGFGGKNWQLYKVPILRVMINGSFAVALFFVISGFALSIAPVVAMRKKTRNPSLVFKRLASAIFRRPARLYLPSLFSTLCVLVLVRLDYFGRVQRRQETYEILVAGYWNWSIWPQRFPTLLEQVMHWISMTIDQNVLYNGVIWTIRIEYRCSLGLYLAHAVLYWMRRTARTWIVLSLIACFTITGDWTMPLFFAGYLIAEYAVLSTEEALVEGSGLPSHLEGMSGPLKAFWRPNKGLFSLFWTVLPCLCLLIGLFLGSMPAFHPEDVPEYFWEAFLTPSRFAAAERFWFGVGGILVVFGVSRIPMITRFHSSPLMKYAGKISFSFYLVHGPIIHGIGRVIFYHCYSLTGQDTMVGAFAGFCMGYASLLAIVVCIADVFSRAVDEPVVYYAKRLEDRLFLAD